MGGGSPRACRSVAPRPDRPLRAFPITPTPSPAPLRPPSVTPAPSLCHSYAPSVTATPSPSPLRPLSVIPAPSPSFLRRQEPPVPGGHTLDGPPPPPPQFIPPPFQGEVRWGVEARERAEASCHAPIVHAAPSPPPLHPLQHPYTLSTTPTPSPSPLRSLRHSCAGRNHAPPTRPNRATMSLEERKCEQCPTPPAPANSAPQARPSTPNNP